MFILSTNHKDRLDPAILNRVDISNQVTFAAPGEVELERLFKHYLDLHITKNNFGVDPSVRDNMPKLLAMLKGLVGRQVSSALAQSIYKLLTTRRTTLDFATLQEVLRDSTLRSDTPTP